MSFFRFARKRNDKRKSLDQSSISAGNSPQHLPRIQRPVSQNLDVAPRTSAYNHGARNEKKDKAKWMCGLCRKQLVEPRLLGCLHSFCTRCLQNLPQEGEADIWSEIDGGSVQHQDSRSGSIAGSAGSGYESDLHSDGSWEQRPQKYGIFSKKISGKNVQFVMCPTCNQETALPLGGVSALPLNYVTMRKIIASERDEDCANLLCDLCNSDTKAESRCGQCLVSVCSSCGDTHNNQKSTARHSLQPLESPPVKYCSHHPKVELNVYCATCQQVICRDCGLISHTGHALANASRAAAERARLLRDACDRAKHVPENVDIASRTLSVQALEADSRAAQVEGEVWSWGARYRRAVDAHTRALAAAAGHARRAHQARASRSADSLAQSLITAKDAVKFTEELLLEATEDELLSLSGHVLRRLEDVSCIPASSLPRFEMRLAPNAPSTHDSTLVGRLFTQAPDPEKSVLNVEGLQDLKVDIVHEAILELRDSDSERIWCGGDQVAGYFRRRDSSARPAPAQVHDRGDGTYSVAILPPRPGTYLLAVTLNNKPIKGSPFPCAARTSASTQHTGQFHCCAFCSSGGRRDAECGCGSTMGAGYKGCGHGHAGHPGARHWSCCGSTQRRGLCRHRSHSPPRPLRRNTIYQFSL